MSSPFDAPAAPSHTSRDVSIDYLRALITVLVVLLHCTVPYTEEAQRFRPAVWMSPTPVIDHASSLVCDYVLTLTDAVVMPLMFFISGLFMDAGLRRRGAAAYLGSRLERLGLPYLAMVVLLMPLAYSAAWGLAHPGQSILRFWMVDARAGLTSGPGWFLWLLLFFECVVAAAFARVAPRVARMAGWLRSFAERPGLAAVLLLAVGWLLYVPLYMHFQGFWTAVVVPAFFLQPSRVLLYAAWLVAGLLVGSAGLDEGLLARRGRLARAWGWWAGFAVAAVSVLWVGLRLGLLFGLSGRAGRAGLALAWVVAETALSLGLLAVFRARVARRRGWADSLARHAYVIYAVHYVFALWVERLLLPVEAPGLAKCAFCFAVVLGLSWGAAILWLRLYGWLMRELGGFAPGHAPRSLAAGRRA